MSALREIGCLQATIIANFLWGNGGAIQACGEFELIGRPE